MSSQGNMRARIIFFKRIHCLFIYPYLTKLLQRGLSLARLTSDRDAESLAQGEAMLCSMQPRGTMRTRGAWTLRTGVGLLSDALSCMAGGEPLLLLGSGGIPSSWERSEWF